jgi:pantoate--beta-alanine ligase
VREGDGLALSSRNQYLSPAERQAAPALYRTLRGVADKIAAAKSAAAVAAAIEDGKRGLLAAGFAKVEYLELRDAESLAPVTSLDRPARLLAAAWLGKTRLIDNVPVGP